MLPEDQVEELEGTEVSDEVAKEFGESEDTPSESTDEETSSPEDDDSSRTETSLKTEEPESEEEKEVAEKVKETAKGDDEDDTRFDKHPRWKKMQEERDTALEQAKMASELKAKLEGFAPEELGRLKEVGKLLKSNPELAKKVQELVDGHDFRNAEVKGELTKLSSELQRMEQDRALEKYDNKVSSLLSTHKVPDELKDVVSELLESRVIKKQLTFDKIEGEFATIVKQFETANRKRIASHIETKKSAPVPVSPSARGKVMTTKKEATGEKDIIDELSEGMKALKE